MSSILSNYLDISKCTMYISSADSIFHAFYASLQKCISTRLKNVSRIKRASPQIKAIDNV